MKLLITIITHHFGICTPHTLLTVQNIFYHNHHFGYMELLTAKASTERLRRSKAAYVHRYCTECKGEFEFVSQVLHPGMLLNSKTHIHTLNQLGILRKRQRTNMLKNTDEAYFISASQHAVLHVAAHILNLLNSGNTYKQHMD